jgi:hypothetical protein
MDVGIGAGLVIGAGFGGALGVALDNLPLGITIGTGFGLTLGLSIGSGLNRRGKAATSAVREKGTFALIAIGLILLVAAVATVLLVH